MPQMAPMLWLMLFFYFTLVFILFIVISYYTSIASNLNFISKDELQTQEMIWLW